MDSSFERSEKGTVDWLTPPEIIKALGEFDLDTCAALNQPWATAKTHYTIKDNGLEKKWFGRVYCNPPYGTQTGKWLKKLAQHNNGIALIFARTETNNFFKYIWPKASAILFLKGRLIFYSIHGDLADNSAGAPSCLVAYGKQNAIALKQAGLFGKWFPIINEKPKRIIL
jgi:hypothetical protein